MGSSEATNGDAPALLRLAPGDNVLVATCSLAAGSQVGIDGEIQVLNTAVSLGHKIAAVAISAGAKILKCQAPIGSATCDISVGEHVHLHNMKSDYLPTYARGGGDGDD